MNTSFAVFATETSTSLSPEEIERELSSMWKPINEAHGTSVSRVVLGNVLWLGGPDQLERARAVFQRVVPHYPARIFLLEYQHESEDVPLLASVNAQCFLPEPGAAPVCCEVVHLTFGRRDAWHVRGVVAPLLVTDVQTVLWTALGSIDFPHMAALQEHVDRTIRMASLAKDPVAHVARMLQSAHPTLDLSWFRMAPVREQIAAFFDDPDTGFDLRAVTAVRLFLPTEGRVLSSLLEGQIIGWLGAHLEWKQQAEPTANEALFTRQGEIIRVTGEASDHAALQLEARSGATFSVQLEASSITMSCSEKGGCALTERGLRFGLLGLEAALGLALNTPSRARHFREAAVVALPILTHLRLRGLC